jgi:hypothetical protein
LVRQRKNTTSAPTSASDPLTFLQKLSPAELQRLDEDALVRAAKREEDQRLVDQAFERAVLRHKVRRLEREIKTLKGASPARSCMLSQIIHNIKSEVRKKGQGKSQTAIALSVDRWLEKRHFELKDVCPAGWLKGIEAKKFPRLFSECIKHPTLGGKAKTLITRA